MPDSEPESKQYTLKATLPIIGGSQVVREFKSYYKQSWFKKDAEFEYFVKLRNPTLVYEIDFWSCMQVKEAVDEPDGVAAVLELRDSSRPAISTSERMHRMHDVFTKDITDVMLANLASAAEPPRKRGRLDGDDAVVDFGAPRREPLVRNPNSPYSIRMAHVRKSIYNAGMDKIQEFDEKARHWELDSAANDLASWQHLVKAMVTAVTAAIISTKADERKMAKMTISEMVESRLLQPHQKNYSYQQFVRESSMAALWDCGLPERSMSTGKAPDLSSVAGIDVFLNRTEQMLAGDLTLTKDQQAKMAELLKDQRVRQLFQKNATVEPSYLEKATAQRRERAMRDVGQGPPLMHREAEHTFAEQVWGHFENECKGYESPLVLHAYRAELPIEGLGYTPLNIQFGVCAFDEVGHLNFSIGHGIGLMVEATEIAVGFLQHSKWAMEARARAQSRMSTVDKPMFTDGIDADSQAGKFPETTEELLCNPVALESYVAELSPQTRAGKTVSEPHKVMTERNADVRAALEKTWWKRTPPDETTLIPVPGVSGGVFVDRDIAAPSERQTAILNCFLRPKDLGTFLAQRFMGGVFLRSALLERPLFAKLVQCTQQKNIIEFAQKHGFEDLREIDKNSNGSAKKLIFAAMKHEISEHNPTGRRMNHLLQPLIVSVYSGDCRSFMTVDSYWGPKRDFWAVEAECCFEIRQVLTNLFQNRSRPSHMEGTLGEKAYGTGFNHLHDLVHLVRNSEIRQTAAGIVVRLIEAVQSSNESIKDSGKVHRQKEARAHVNDSRVGYATLLVKVTLN